MAKTRTTVTLDEEVLRAVKVRAARTGKGDSQVDIQRACREADKRHHTDSEEANQLDKVSRKEKRLKTE